MSRSEIFRELISSQIPALQLLMNLGWKYLTPSEALAYRDGKEKNVVLTGILEPWLYENNVFERKGRQHHFSAKNIKEAVRQLVNVPLAGLLPTNEALYERLTLGTSLSETIDGDSTSPSLKYIDWQHPENNVYHVTDEFSVERRGTHTKRRPDIVLFVNGIPLVVIECKRSDLDGQAIKRDPRAVGEDEPEHIGYSASEAISQMVRNQNDDEIPHLFVYSQLLLAIHMNEAFYGTVRTPLKFWSVWREEESNEADLYEAINRPTSEADKARLFNWRAYPHTFHRHFAQFGERQISEQDRLIFSLLRPARLLELTYQFLVYDNGQKKVSRYQQYFAIKKTIERVAHLNPQGKRTGGVIWHTTGSGKSLTMVMLAKALALHPNIKNPRVILVTDRVNLDDQIYGTFHACGKSVVQAQDGKHLVRLVTSRLKEGEKNGDVITAVINKFEQAARDKARDESHDIFVLVDESHRSQYGSMHSKMVRVFPNACYIGFTGTPLTKKEKSTAEKFGSFIHKYPMRQAVKDRAVVPLLYEGRIVEQDVSKDQLERWFDRMTRHLNEQEKADLKRKMSRSEVVNATEQRIKEIAYNIALHYEQNWRGKGLKGQLATASKEVGLKYLRYLREYGIDAALSISPPDTREGHNEVGEEDIPAVQAFWKQMMDRYQTEDNYNNEILRSFHDPEGIEILVVVDKLLTGFDEPRNTVLYIDKPLKEHTLLQAIARVNRLFEGKDYGYIIDYRGVLGQLNEAMNLYDALAEYDAEDIQGTIADIAQEVAKLPQIHSDLWSIFQPVRNKSDLVAMQQHLEPEDRRQHFYEQLTAYARTLRIALSTTKFYEDTPEKQIQMYKDDLKFFHRLRHSVQKLYAEIVDFQDYEGQVRKLLDEYVQATGITTITELVNVFDEERFDEEVAKLESPRAKADTILNRMKRTIIEHMDEDPALYRRFAELVEETIQAYREGRINELEYLQTATNAMDQLRSGRDASQPDVLNRYAHAPSYYGILRANLIEQCSDEQAAQVAIQIEELLQDSRVTDWTINLDVQQRMKRKLDELLFDRTRKLNLSLSDAELDMLIEQILEVAKARDYLTS